MKPPYWEDAVRKLARRDSVMRGLIRAYPGLHLQRRNDAFTTLARAIVGQQISVKAADAVWRRLLVVAAPDKAHQRFPRLRPEAILRLSSDALYEAGLSRRKVDYVCDLARHFAEGTLKPRTWKNLDDETLIERLVAVRGIGRWTAEMFLIFHELRADVLPIADLGLQKALRLHYHGQCPDTDAMILLAEQWRPYRSVATWYLWRALDPVAVEY